MAATNGTVTFDGGRVTISIYNPAASAAGTYLGISKSQVALSTDDTRVFVKNGATITDIVPTAATGTIVPEVNGTELPNYLDYAQFGATNSGRPRLNIYIPPNSWLRFKVKAALAA